MISFKKKVLEVVSKIPSGKVLTYKEVARRAGSPRAYRAVGNILHSYDAALHSIPCHRVVRCDGKAGGFRWGSENKKAMLRKEGLRLK
jgi:AraC family transcriptional regulator of adaptative response/methylated-DNA-[protein]-cysteine methyltransferase